MKTGVRKERGLTSGKNSVEKRQIHKLKDAETIRRTGWICRRELTRAGV